MGDAMLDAAARAAGRMQFQQPAPQPQQQGIPLELLIRMVECKTLTPKQLFEAVFLAIPPKEFQGEGK